MSEQSVTGERSTAGQTTEYGGGRVLVTITDGVADVVLNRPDKKNALDQGIFDGIVGALAALQTPAESGEVRAVVLSGAGGVFSAGIDLSLLAGGAGVQGIQERTHGPANVFQHVGWGWRALPVPVIAAVDGVCFGGGLQIALGADLRFATADARLAVMEARWALVPDMAGFPLLRGCVRADVMRELVYTGREVIGEEAAALGLVTRVVDDPHAEARALAAQIARQAPATTRAAKRLLGLTLDEVAPPADVLMAESVEQEPLLLGALELLKAAGR